MSSTVADAARGGDRVAALLALRDCLAESIDVAEPQYRAALARQLALVLEQLAGMAVPEVSARDEIAAKRDARRGAQVADGSDVAKQRGGGSRRAGGKRGAGT